MNVSGQAEDVLAPVFIFVQQVLKLLPLMVNNTNYLMFLTHHYD